MPEDVAILDLSCMPRYIHSGYRIFESGKRHVTRKINICVLVFVLEGILYMTEEGEPKVVESGHWYLERPNRRMQAHLPSPKLKFYYVHFTALASGQGAPGFHLADPGNFDEPASGSMNFPVQGSFPVDAFVQLFDRLDQVKLAAPNDHLLRQGIFLELMAALLDTAYPQADPETRLVKEVLDYLTVQSERGIKVADLCQVFHFTPDYLSRLLRQKIGIPAKEYLQRLRLRRAMELLNNTDLPIAQVAELSGFGDETLLFRTFKARIGETPAHWRKHRR